MTQKHPPEAPPPQADIPDVHDILMNLPIGIFRSTPGGKYLFGNTPFAEMLGYETPEELAKSVTDIAGQVYADPDERREFMRLMQENGQVRRKRLAGKPLAVSFPGLSRMRELGQNI